MLNLYFWEMDATNSISIGWHFRTAHGQLSIYKTNFIMTVSKKNSVSLLESDLSEPLENQLQKKIKVNGKLLSVFLSVLLQSPVEQNWCSYWHQAEARTGGFQERKGVCWSDLCTEEHHRAVPGVEHPVIHQLHWLQESLRQLASRHPMEDLAIIWSSPKDGHTNRVVLPSFRMQRHPGW